MKITIDSDKCDGCRICEQICVFSHEKEFNPRRARIKVMRTEREGIAVPVTCNQCQKCIDACPTSALSWDEAVGVVRVDNDSCNGCGACVESCESGTMFIHPVTGIATTCDLCNGDPQCVKWCPEGVLRYEAKAASKV